MISYVDCVGLCGLPEDVVRAVAAHERVPDIVAAAMAGHLVASRHGPDQIRDMIVEDVRAAQAQGERERVQELLHVLHHFLRCHPEACQGPRCTH